MRIPVRSTFATAWALCFIASAASAGPLFAPLESGSTHTRAARARAALFDTAYRALAEDPAMANFQIVTVDAAQVTQRNRVISLNLAPGVLVTARQVDSYRTKEGLIVWHGILLDGGVKGPQLDPLRTVTLVRNGNKLTGTVHYAGEWYHIRPLRRGGHALVAVAVDRLPAEHADESAMPVVLPAPAPLNPATEAAASTTRTVIRLMVNYTEQAAAATGDILGLITLAVAETNQSYANSGVQIDLELAGTSQTSYIETTNSSTDMRRYRGTRDGYMDEIHATRTSLAADIGVLLVRNLAGCGIASGIGSTYETAFAIVELSCATGANRYTFGHEIGHLLWARHDPESDSRNRPYPFGHGYRQTSPPAFRTMMGVDCIPACAERVLYWSSPSLLYNGVPMGTDATSNNARVLNTTKTTVAGFFAPACIPDGGVTEASGAAGCCSGYTVPGAILCNHQGDCTQICGTPPVDGCVPSGGVDDVLSATSCCSGAAVAGSAWCLDQDDWGTDWTTCVQTCQ